MNNIIAQLKIGNQVINSPLVIANKTNPKVGDIVSAVTNFLIPIGAVILFFILIWGGYDYLLSQGSPEKVKSAQAKITYGIIGFVLLVLSFLIVKLIAYIFNLGGGIF